MYLDLKVRRTRNGLERSGVKLERSFLYIWTLISSFIWVQQIQILMYKCLEIICLEYVHEYVNFFFHCIHVLTHFF